MPKIASRPPIHFWKQGEPLDVVVARIGTALATSFESILSQLPGAPLRPQELARTTNMNKDFSSRIIKALELKDPIAVTHAIPGPEPLRRMLKAASEKGAVNRQTMQSATEAIEQFDALIRSVAGDRSGLDTIISAWLPEARERIEIASRQAVFKGMSQIKGCCANQELNAILWHPSSTDAHRWDRVTLTASFGLRRLRPGADIHYETIDLTRESPAPAMSLDGESVSHASHLMLEQFCSSPTPRLGATEAGNKTHYSLLGDDVGLPACIDLVFAELREAMKKSGDRGGFFVAVQIPVQVVIFDVLLHREVYPGIEPSLLIYDTAVKGVAHNWDPARDIDRLDVKASIDFLGTGVTRFRAAQVPNYIDMLRYVCGRRGWDPQEFRGYRCVIEYPIYGSQIFMQFDPATARSSPRR